MTQFKKGKSGNPSGRPPGIEDRRTRFRRMVETRAPELIDKAVEKALDSDQQMVRLLLERLLPARPRDEVLPLQLAGDPSTMARHVLSNLESITPSEAAALLQGIAASARVIEADELERRIAKLEEKRKC